MEHAIKEALWAVVGGGGDYINGPESDFDDEDVYLVVENLRRHGFQITPIANE